MSIRSANRRFPSTVVLWTSNGRFLRRIGAPIAAELVEQGRAMIEVGKGAMIHSIRLISSEHLLEPTDRRSTNSLVTTRIESLRDGNEVVARILQPKFIDARDRWAYRMAVEDNLVVA